jgi:murein DD-endopeptidase MepM/ murein hydrolase activator NlpD
VKPATLTRTLRLGCVGDDVFAAKRIVAKGLEDGPPVGGAAGRTFGPFFVRRVNQLRAKFPMAPSGEFNQRMLDECSRLGLVDNYSRWLLDEYARKHTRPAIVYPHPAGARSSVCQGLHPTAGVPGNWGIDFCAPGGTPVCAVEDATITKLSGRDPRGSVDQSIGIFGWSIHYQTPRGYHYFSTHYGHRDALTLGQHVAAGQRIGSVGTWPGSPGRSHTHLGVTSPYGTSDARKRIMDVSRAPRVSFQ